MGNAATKKGDSAENGNNNNNSNQLYICFRSALFIKLYISEFLTSTVSCRRQLVHIHTLFAPDYNSKVVTSQTNDNNTWLRYIYT